MQPFEEQGIFLETVRRVDIFELGRNYRIMARHTIEESLADGAVIEYPSIVGKGGPPPNALQVVVTALTGDGVSVMNMWSITFEDFCILPVLWHGANIGWSEVVSRYLNSIVG